MKKLIIITLMLCCLSGIVWAQTATVQALQQDIQNYQNDINTQEINISNNTAANAVAQAKIVSDTSAIVSDNQLIAQINENNATNVTGVNWDYYISLENVGIRYAQWSTVSSGINWNGIIPQLGVNCAVQESNVNWPNWGNCKANGMTPSSPFAGFLTGVAAFWCGQGSISGTC